MTDNISIKISGWVKEENSAAGLSKVPVALLDEEDQIFSVVNTSDKSESLGKYQFVVKVSKGSLLYLWFPLRCEKDSNSLILVKGSQSKKIEVGEIKEANGNTTLAVTIDGVSKDCHKEHDNTSYEIAIGDVIYKAAEEGQPTVDTNELLQRLEMNVDALVAGLVGTPPAIYTADVTEVLADIYDKKEAWSELDDTASQVVASQLQHPDYAELKAKIAEIQKTIAREMRWLDTQARYVTPDNAGEIEFYVQQRTQDQVAIVGGFLQSLGASVHERIETVTPPSSKDYQDIWGRVTVTSDRIRELYPKWRISPEIKFRGSKSVGQVLRGQVLQRAGAERSLETVDYLDTEDAQQTAEEERLAAQLAQQTAEEERLAKQRTQHSAEEERLAAQRAQPTAEEERLAKQRAQQKVKEGRRARKAAQRKAG